MTAVQVKPGRTFGTAPSIVTTTLKLVARVAFEAAAPVAWIGLLPTSVTLLMNVWSGSASMVTLAR